MRNETGRMNTRNVNNTANEYYIDGNTVRRMETAPDYRRERQERIERERQEELRKRQRAARRNQEKALRMSRSYAVFLVMAVAVFGIVAGAYIKVQSDITARMKTIAKLESGLPICVLTMMRHTRELIQQWTLKR